MLRDTTIALDRAWNTWSSRPAEMVFLPLGVRLTPVGYSDHLRRATAFPPGPEVSLREHTLDGSQVNLTLSHGGTQLSWAWSKHDPFTVIGRWNCEQPGEWGLRFWLSLCLSSEGQDRVRLVDGAALIKVGTRHVALCSSHPPVQVTGHDNLEALLQDYEDNGYFHLASRATEAPLLAFRFNLEMMPSARIAAAVADDAALAIRRARALLEERRTPVRLSEHTGQSAGALDAIRDVMAWNGVYDEVNRRPYTCISRNWNQRKFGGFGVWLNDQLFHALATGLFDAGISRENLRVALAGATPQGNLACLVTANDAWVDRSQVPVGGFIVRLLYERHRDASLVRDAFETLARNHEWWWQTRDPLKRGLLAYGSSDLGEALYVGTSFGARNESCMDNSPVHDEATFDAATRTLTTYDVGLNSLLALDAECLGYLARVLGLSEQAAALEARGEDLRRRIQSELWDEKRKIFANRLRDGRFVSSVAPTSFYPLLCGAASARQAEELLLHLDDASTFAGRFPLPSVARDDPAFADNSYWRGRIWPPLNFLVWQGLRRYGFDARAGKLARDSFALFRRSWEGQRLCPENFNADTGEALDQPDTEGFYGWGVLMPWMAVAEIVDANPWGGWEVQNGPEDVSLGPVLSPAGAVHVERTDGRLVVRRLGQVLLRTRAPGRFSRLRLEEGYISLRLPSHLPPGTTLELPQLEGREVLLARLDETPISFDADGTLALPAGGERRTLVVVYR
jgi:putative isomerase